MHMSDNLPCNELDARRDPAESQASYPEEIKRTRPGYPKPVLERLGFAEKQLTEVEQYIAPESAVLASLLVRALLARNCTTAEAMWAIYSQIETGRYKAALLAELPSTVNYIVNEHNPPAGVDVASGVLHIDGDAGDWGLLVITLPKREETMEEQQASGADSVPIPRAEADGDASLGQLIRTLEGSESAFVANSRTADRVDATEGSIAAQWWRMQAAALKFQPNPARMPGIDRIEVLCDELAGGTGLNATNVRQLRARLCRLKGCSLQEAVAYSLTEAADVLEEAAGGQGEAGRAEGDVSSETSNAVLLKKKAKRRTERGEARAKIIGMLLKHHQYANNDSCLNTEPIVANKLAEIAEVGKGSVNRFFNSEFNDGEKGGYANYKRACRDPRTLEHALKLLSGDLRPSILFKTFSNVNELEDTDE
jgi:hypothetical protein